MDIIKLTNIVLYAHHGYYKAERELGQRFELDIEVECNLRQPAKSDNLHHTINYQKVYTLVRSIMIVEMGKFLQFFPFS